MPTFERGSTCELLKISLNSIVRIISSDAIMHLPAAAVSAVIHAVLLSSISKRHSRYAFLRKRGEERERERGVGGEGEGRKQGREASAQTGVSSSSSLCMCVHLT